MKKYLFVSLILISVSCRDMKNETQKICDCYNQINNIGDVLEKEKYCVQAHIELRSHYAAEQEDAARIDSIIKVCKMEMVQRVSNK